PAARLEDERQGGAIWQYAHGFHLGVRGDNCPTWAVGKQDWEVTRVFPEDECDIYGRCGQFGSCNLEDSPICTSLKGFEPKNEEEWSRGNWTGGCCDRNNTKGEVGKEDGFLKLSPVKVPDFAEWPNVIQDKCGSQCLINCSCIAYAYYLGVGCMHWSGTLVDIQKFSDSVGADLYIRVAHTELVMRNKKNDILISFAYKKRSIKVIIASVIIKGSISVVVSAYITWKWMAKITGTKRRSDLGSDTTGGAQLVQGLLTNVYLDKRSQ
ncbi:hypothetical protein RJ640_022349, partial [Escallonia rubra]